MPILLFYVYGVVPVSLCRSGGCGVSTSPSGGVRFDFDDEESIEFFSSKGDIYIYIFYRWESWNCFFFFLARRGIMDYIVRGRGSPLNKETQCVNRVVYCSCEIAVSL